MHEMGIADSVLTAVIAETARYPGNRACKVGLRIGELAGIDPDSLRFCFDALIKGSELASLVLEIQLCSRRHRCACGHEFAVRDYEFQCPSCSSLQTKCVSGDELELAFVELEEYEPIAIGTKGFE